MGVILEAKDLKVGYKVDEGFLWAVNGVSFSIEEGEIFGIVGESGCGKTTLALSFLRLLPPQSRLEGELLFNGMDVFKLKEEELRGLRGREMGMVFQDPTASLNPIMKIKDHFLETIKAHLDVSEAEALNMASWALESVGVSPLRLESYPFELSVGQRQRVMIALALALRPKVIIADEPTASLDVIVQSQVLDLMASLRDAFKMTIVFITRDPRIIARVADRVMVMYAGEAIEIAPKKDFFSAPLHPYSKGLLLSLPSLDLEDSTLYPLEGFPPDPFNPPKGCRFHPRCFEAMDICGTRGPKVYRISKSRWVKCWKYHG